MELKKLGISQVDAKLMAYVRETADLLRNLPKYYEQSSMSVTQKLIGSIQTGKLIFEENEYRTTELNEIIVQIRNVGADAERL